MTMNREPEQDQLIDLGAASTETRGLPWGMDDFQAGLYVHAGLSAE
jgi:hypothetical protein